MEFIITISGPANGARAAIANVVREALRGQRVAARFEEETRNHQGPPVAGSVQLAIQQFNPSVTILERVGEPSFPVVTISPDAPVPVAAGEPATVPPVPNPYHNPFIAVRNKAVGFFRRKHASPPP